MLELRRGQPVRILVKNNLDEMSGVHWHGLEIESFPDGVAAPSFYQKRAPESRPPWIEVVTMRFPSGRTADEVVPRDAGSLAWLANLACLELHPHLARRRQHHAREATKRAP